MATEALVQQTGLQAGEATPAPPSRFHRPVAVVLGCIFLFAPTIAFAVGVRAKPIENRRLAAGPSPSDGWNFFPETSSWFTDHVPLRNKAVDAYSTMIRKVFREEPSFGDSSAGVTSGIPSGANGGSSGGSSDTLTFPTVVTGKEGWIYYGGDFEHTCRPTRKLDDTWARLQRLASIITKSGRRFVFTIAPDKTTIDPQQLPDTYIGKQCAAERKRQFWQRLQDQPPPGYFDLKGPLERQQHADGQPIYLPTDSHWNSHGAAVYAEQLAEALEPGLWEGSVVTRLPDASSGGDLEQFVGRTDRYTIPMWRTTRVGVRGDFQQYHLLGRVPFEVRNTTKAARLFQPTTLVLGDSFTNRSQDAVYSLFSHVIGLAGSGAAPQAIASAVKKVKVVVFECVERNVDGGSTPVLSDKTLDAIERALS